jgi:hypothetical protein
LEEKMKSKLARIHNILAWTIFAGCFVQIYLIALYVFKAVLTPELHAATGFLLALVALLSLIVALIIRVNKWNIILSLVVFLLLFPVQGILAYSDVGGAIRALHGLTGMLILSFSYILANGFAKAVWPQLDTSSKIADASAAAIASD